MGVPKLAPKASEDSSASRGAFITVIRAQGGKIPGEQDVWYRLSTLAVKRHDNAAEMAHINAI